MLTRVIAFSFLPTGALFGSLTSRSTSRPVAYALHGRLRTCPRVSSKCSSSAKRSSGVNEFRLLCAEVAIQSPAVVCRNTLTSELNHGRSQKIVTPEFQEEADYRSCGARTHAFVWSKEIECSQSRSTPTFGIPTPGRS